VNLPPDDARHGTNYAYSRLGCRCVECADGHAAHTARRRASRAKAGGLPPGDPRHGTVNAYTNYGCRCAPCKDAMSEKNALRRAASS
jgi:hypothetical protein